MKRLNDWKTRSTIAASEVQAGSTIAVPRSKLLAGASDDLESVVVSSVEKLGAKHLRLTTTTGIVFYLGLEELVERTADEEQLKLDL